MLVYYFNVIGFLVGLFRENEVVLFGVVVFGVVVVKKYSSVRDVMVVLNVFGLVSDRF